MKRTQLWVAGAVVSWLCGCRGGSSPGTGLYVTVDLGGATTVDQIEFAVGGAPPGGDGGVGIPPTMRPSAPGPALRSPQSIVIYLADGLAGTVVTVSATGFTAGGRLDLTAAAAAAVQRGALVSVPLALAPGATKPNGDACAGGAACASGVCVEGVCCDSACDGLCVSCKVSGKQGSCSPVPVGARNERCADQGATSCGFDGTCDGSAGCRRYPAGVACGLPACTGTTYAPPPACDGAGACVPAAAVDCAPFVCDPAAQRCRVSCAGDGDCVTGRSCVAEGCGPKVKKPHGAGCLTIDDCVSGFCADGVCCDGACDGACLSCNQPGTPGSCGPVPAGRPDPRRTCPTADVTTCGTSGLCDGAGACARYAEGTVCSVPSCNTRNLQIRRCDAAGACRQANIDCAPWRCDPASEPKACYTRCTENAQCATGTGAACDVDAGACR